jgi:release factor glutamine methyltransferase
MLVIELINTASGHLGEKGFDNPRLEVELLLGSVLNLSRIELYLGFDRPLSETELCSFRTLYRRRLSHEPLQHILGHSEFREIKVKNDRRALIPRPETELLAEIAIEYLSSLNSPFAADIGTGTGVIALSIVHEVPAARVIATDISPEALRLAEENAHLLGLIGRITFVYGDMLGVLDGRGEFDAIISNPPYVKTGDIENLQPEVRLHDPSSALDGGRDGMFFLKLIGQNAHVYLKNGGLLALECSDEQAEILKEIIDNTDVYSEIDIIRDYADKKRIVKAFKKL